ncbi:MAG: nucleotidyltransferase family protein [Chloroflexota bacterium]|nr:nucleotidyltransferase family protein [Chloroflexota bacterium]MDE2968781.1 nucleotidyltransferase family protein [Chloroflexota bacterium]
MPGVAAVLLAAGESSRMGQPKPLLLWGDVPLVRYQVESLAESGAAPIVVVLGPTTLDAEACVTDISNVRTVVNQRAPEGKTTSVRLGVSHVDADADSILLLAVDQPRTPAIIRSVIEVHLAGNAHVTHPTYEGRGGHPIVFHASLRAELLAISEERQGIREVVGRHLDSLQRVELGDPMVRLDINTLEDYRAALERYVRAG